MGIEQQRRNSIREYIRTFISLVEEYESFLISKPQYSIDQHAKILRDKLDETSNMI